MATWDEKQGRWRTSVGTPPNRRYFFSNVPGEAGRLDVEEQKRLFIDGPAPLRKGSLAEFIQDRWWPFVEKTMAYETARAYKSIYDRLIPEWFLAKLIRDISESDVADIVEEMVHGVSAKTARNRVGVIQSIFAHLVRTKRLKKTENPCQDIELPKIVRRKARRDLTIDLGKRLEELFADTPYEGPIWTAQRLGCRPNETLGLRPEDIVVRSKDAVIRFAINRQRHEVKEQLKNRVAGEHRVIIVPRDWGVKMLSYHYPGSPYLFCDRSGKPLNPTTLRSRFYQVIKQYNEALKLAHAAGERENEVPIKITNRELRNMAVSNLLRQGVPIATVADQVGHSSTEVTMIYKDLNESESRDAFSSLSSAYETKAQSE